MDYKDYIKNMKRNWVGRRVLFEGKVYWVENVDYNGCLLINKPAQFTETTAVATYMVEVIK